jgi:hypothetical protein
MVSWENPVSLQVKWCHATPTLKADLQVKDWSDITSVTLNIKSPAKRDGAQVLPIRRVAGYACHT